MEPELHGVTIEGNIDQAELVLFDAKATVGKELESHRCGQA
jgi:hypothetical protein